MSAPDPWDYDDAFDDDDGLEEDFDCGMHPDGTCSMAGSEWCDWECPYNRPSTVSTRLIALAEALRCASGGDLIALNSPAPKEASK